jgi:hypothetical protein
MDVPRLVQPFEVRLAKQLLLGRGSWHISLEFERTPRACSTGAAGSQHGSILIVYDVPHLHVLLESNLCLTKSLLQHLPDNSSSPLLYWTLVSVLFLEASYPLQYCYLFLIFRTPTTMPHSRTPLLAGAQELPPLTRYLVRDHV